LMLQLLNAFDLPPEQALYVTLDDLYFSEHKLTDFVNAYRKTGGRMLFMDEIHKYPGWSQELKNIYDYFPQMRIYFSGSSMLKIYHGRADLSRRVVHFVLPELSLREYLALKYGLHLPVLEWDDLIRRHVEIAREWSSKFLPVKVLKEYFRLGAYPYFMESETYYPYRLRQTVNTILETDLPALENIRYESVYKLKKLLHMIAESPPFTPNIQHLSRDIGTSRDKLLRYLNLLEDAGLIIQIRSEQKQSGTLRKPDKILLSHPNLAYALADEKNVRIGSVREMFFVNQTSRVFPVYYSKTGDYQIKNYVFEIGGKSKKAKQIQGLENAFIVKDDLETGYGNVIPLWMFGFLY